MLLREAREYRPPLCTFTAMIRPMRVFIIVQPPGTDLVVGEIATVERADAEIYLQNGQAERVTRDGRPLEGRGDAQHQAIMSWAKSHQTNG